MNVVNVAFTIIEEGTRARSVSGNHTIAIMKVSETYDELVKGLQDICQKAKDLEVVTILARGYTRYHSFRQRLEISCNSNWIGKC